MRGCVVLALHSVLTHALLSRPRKITRPTLRLAHEGDVSYIEDDGYSLSGDEKKRVPLRLRWWSKPPPGTLILVRHGESEWNRNSTFTGWCDVDLSPLGESEIEHAARLLLEAGLVIDVAYTSRLKRAIRSTWILLSELGQIYRPVFKSWRLNERHYGALTGLSKPGLALDLGEEQVQRWRHGLHDIPPPMPEDGSHAYDSGKERKYADLPPELIPRSESLQDTMVRTLPLWETRVLRDLKAGRNVLVMAHGNSLRGMIKHIDSMNEQQITAVSIPNGIPLIYKFARANGQLTPLRALGAVGAVNGEFLEKPGLLRAALLREKELKRHIPGYTESFVPSLNSPQLRSLAKLELERKLIQLAGDLSALELARAAADTGQAQRPPVAASEGIDAMYMGFAPPPKPKAAAAAAAAAAAEEADPAASTTGADEVPLPLRSASDSATVPRPVVVIVRHGKTEFNKLGVFTGWEDAPLAAEGRAEAKKAGELLRAHGIELDVVYTSWLSRAIDTAWIMLTELDTLWVPIVKTWRLNERMYGALTGLSKKMIKQRHGEERFMKWRRSYHTRPPPASSFSMHYPGNDERYTKYVTDVRWSFKESLVRTLADGKLTLARKLPRTESLKDCMERTIPYFTEYIEPAALDQSRNVLIASSENAIRGLVMHLCDIPPERIAEVEIPTGLPLIYDVQQRCLKLLDDGNYHADPAKALQRYNFGTATDLLFRPCDPNNPVCELNEDGIPDPIIRLPKITTTPKSSDL